MRSNSYELVVVDDDPLALQAIQSVLSAHYQVHPFTEPEAALNTLETRSIAAVILDLNLSRQTGLEILPQWKKRFPDVEFVFCSGETKVERAIDCLRQGATDFVVKPFRSEDLLLILQRVVEKYSLKKRIEKLSPLLHPHPVHLIAESKPMVDLIHKVQLLKGNMHLNVLLLGESGTGKEILARYLHQQEADSSRPFVVANMPAIPASLMESELFGVEKGAFTDAKASRPGKFELADGGDIFLDEMGDLALETQAKILRVLQEKQVERIGSHRVSQVSFRVIAATNQPLADLMSSGRFREDLMFRLSDMVLWIPPLRERKEDIPSLAEHFLQKYSLKEEPPKLSSRALDKLLHYDWPGNIRQLESTLKRALVFSPAHSIEDIEIFDPTMLNPRALPAQSSDAGFSNDLSYDSQMEIHERALFQQTLKRFSGDKNAALKALKLSRATFYRKLAKYQFLE